jgi:hypothetical protein
MRTVLLAAQAGCMEWWSDGRDQWGEVNGFVAAEGTEEFRQKALPTEKWGGDELGMAEKLNS